MKPTVLPHTAIDEFAAHAEQSAAQLHEPDGLHAAPAQALARGGRMMSSRLRMAHAYGWVPFDALPHCVPDLARSELRKLHRFQREQEQQGAAVVVLHWPDSTWCVLAQHVGPLALVIALDDDAALAAYEDARAKLAGNYLPTLVARFHHYH